MYRNHYYDSTRDRSTTGVVNLVHIVSLYFNAIYLSKERNSIFFFQHLYVFRIYIKKRPKIFGDNGIIHPINWRQKKSCIYGLHFCRNTYRTIKITKRLQIFFLFAFVFPCNFRFITVSSFSDISLLVSLHALSTAQNKLTLNCFYGFIKQP